MQSLSKRFSQVLTVCRRSPLNRVLSGKLQDRWVKQDTKNMTFYKSSEHNLSNRDYEECESFVLKTFVNK